MTGLPPDVDRLLRLASAVPEREGARRATARIPFLAKFGQPVLDWYGSASETVEFVGATALSIGRFARGKARFRKSDFAVVMQEVGADALPIVCLISFLIGVILAFVGAVQLEQFGAQIYVANLVAVGVLREMGAPRDLLGGVRVVVRYQVLVFERRTNIAFRLAPLRQFDLRGSEILIGNHV